MDGEDASHMHEGSLLPHMHLFSLVWCFHCYKEH